MPITLGNTSITGITGNQGIGTDSPASTLDLGPNTSGEQRLSFSGVSSLFPLRGGVNISLGMGYQSSTTVSGQYQSSVAFALARAMISAGGSQGIRFFTDGVSTVPVGNDITPTERMRIDSAGRVTMPFQPVVEVSRTSSFSVSNNEAIGTVVPWSIEHIDRGNNFDRGGTNRFTAPAAGCYQFHWSYGSNIQSNTVYRSYLWLNGSRVTHSQLRNDNSKTGSAYSWGSRTLILNLSTNDYVELRASSDNGTSFLADAALRVSMGIYLIG